MIYKFNIKLQLIDNQQDSFLVGNVSLMKSNPNVANGKQKISLQKHIVFEGLFLPIFTIYHFSLSYSQPFSQSQTSS